MKKVWMIVMVILMVVGLCACRQSSKEKVLIYTSSDENEITVIRGMLDKKFPNYDISVEYLSTGDHAAKLKAEGTSTECDISYDLEYGYMEMLDKENIFANLSEYDTSKYIDDLKLSENYLPTMRYGGAIIVNNKVLEEKGLEKPKSYQDLLKPDYKNLISMPNPSASGTGYMFLKNLVNVVGEDQAFDYFNKLSENILQYTSSGSGPVNALEQQEVAIGLGMSSHAAIKKTKGADFDIYFFEEGSPYLACGTAIIKGKEEKTAVKEVFNYFYTDITEEINRTLYPEKLYKDKDFTMENYPIEINYADMSNNTSEEKERLLSKWNH